MIYMYFKLSCFRATPFHENRKKHKVANIYQLKAVFIFISHLSDIIHIKGCMSLGDDNRNKVKTIQPVFFRILFYLHVNLYDK